MCAKVVLLFIMVIDNNLLDDLTRRAKNSPRLRINYDLRNSEKDQSQRMLNALELDTDMPIHRHRNSSETVVVLRGKVLWIYYDNDGNETDRFLVAPNSDLCGISVPQGQWHSLVCLESGTVIFEAKDGAWEPLAPEDIMEKK